MNEKFLEAFREVENELKQEGLNYKDYEDSLESGITQDRVKICRVMRNYMAHTDTLFIEATNEQVKFLNNLADAIKRKAHLVKDEMKKIKLVPMSSIIMKDLVPMIIKYQVIPMETKQGIYLLTKDIILANLAKGNKKIDVPAKLPKYQTIDKMVRVDSVKAGTYIVTDKDKYVGILIV